MTYTRSLILGLLAAALLIATPLTLLKNERISDDKTAQLIAIGQLQGHLQEEILRLRLGISNNYDNLMDTLHELRIRAHKIHNEAAASAFPEDLDLARVTTTYSEMIDEELTLLVERFPTYNASVINAVASIPKRIQYLQTESAESIEAFEERAKMDARCREALLLQALWNSEDAEQILDDRYLQLGVPDPSHSEERLILDRQFEIAIEHRLAADSIIQSILRLCGDSRIYSEVKAHIQRAQAAERNEATSRTALQAGSFSLAFLICMALCVFGWRQSSVLRSEIEGRRSAEDQNLIVEKELESARRLEAIGQLAAGVAHEINTPTQYVGDNTRFLEESFRELAPLLKKADELAESVRQGTGSSLLAEELKTALEEADVEYLEEEIPRAIEQSLNGIERVRKIVQSMKEFSHPGVEGMVCIDLNRAIESTITVASNEWKYVAELETDFDPELPPVSCLSGEMNQVFLNLIVNAAHAIADVMRDGERGKGTISISTQRDGELVEIRIADTGSGIPKAAQSKIFNPFFTTKEVGKGTGQGLSIAYAVVVNKHGGTLDFETEIGTGTTFIVRIPVAQQAAEGCAA
ncbi:MAG: signal transduction histidine kinase [Planctomycetota bacterium]